MFEHKLLFWQCRWFRQTCSIKMQYKLVSKQSYVGNFKPPFVVWILTVSCLFQKARSIFQSVKILLCYLFQTSWTKKVFLLLFIEYDNMNRDTIFLQFFELHSRLLLEFCIRSEILQMTSWNIFEYMYSNDILTRVFKNNKAQNFSSISESSYLKIATRRLDFFWQCFFCL